MIRTATLSDIDALLQLERTCFTYDRLFRGHFRHLLTKAHADTLVVQEQEVLCGCAVILFKHKSTKARLYSFAVDPHYRRQGIASNLLLAVENCAIEYHCTSLRLETRADNIPMQRLIEQRGYQKFATVVNYYQDHATALRYEKTLISHCN